MNSHLPQVTYSRQSGRLSWSARWRAEHGRAIGNLYHDDKFVRAFNVAIIDRDFKVDIGSGSGVKIAFKA